MPNYYVGYKFRPDEEPEPSQMYTHIEAERFEIRDGWLVFIDSDGEPFKAYGPEEVTVVSRED